MDADMAQKTFSMGHARLATNLQVELLSPLHGKHLDAACSRHLWRHMIMGLLVQALAYIVGICIKFEHMSQE